MLQRGMGGLAFWAGGKPMPSLSEPSVKVHEPLSRLGLALGESATITVFHGPEDCLSSHQDLGYRGTRIGFWPSHSDEVLAKDGENVIESNGLTPG